MGPVITRIAIQVGIGLSLLFTGFTFGTLSERRRCKSGCGQTTEQKLEPSAAAEAQRLTKGWVS